MNRARFESLVAEGLDALPEKFLRKLRNVAVVVEEEPSRTQLQAMNVRRGWTLFGLYEGVPQTARGSSYGWVLPDKITIFQKPIEEAAESDEEIRAIVRDTVWHEIAHHFGMEEGEVRRRERRKRNSGSPSQGKGE